MYWDMHVYPSNGNAVLCCNNALRKGPNRDCSHGSGTVPDTLDASDALEAWWGGTLSWWLLCRSSAVFRFNGESFGGSGSRLIAGCQSVSSVRKVGWKNLWDSRKVCGQSVVLALRKSAVGTHIIQQVCSRNCTGSSISIPWGVDGWAHKLRPNFHPKPNPTLSWGNLIN